MEAAARAPAAKRVNTDGEKRRLFNHIHRKKSCQQNQRVKSANEDKSAS
jgi:hypothetical protein